MPKSKKLTPEEKEQRNKNQCERSLALENALFSFDADNIKKCFAENGNIEFTAEALGFACRFCGLEYVKTLIKYGAGFEFKCNYELYVQFKCFNYATMTKSDYRLMLLGVDSDVSPLSGNVKAKGVFMKKKITLENGKTIDMLPFNERLEIVKYLDKNADKSNFDKNMLYYYSILADDNEMRTALKDMGAALPDNVKAALTVGDTKGIWQRFCETADKMTNEQFITVSGRLAEELNSGFYYSEYLLKHAPDKLTNPETLKVIMERFDRSKMNQTSVMKAIINADNVQALEITEKYGWLKQPKKRDDMIDYAVSNQKTECSAYLLDFKNRTADLAAEREKAEKKEERELNAAPDSVTALKKIWSYKKRDDGTLAITSYKGISTAPVVPEYIGKSKVTAIGIKAFSPCASRMTDQIEETRKSITSVKLPDTIKIIEDSAFELCGSLKEIKLPNSIFHIGDGAFARCGALKNIVIPESAVSLGNMVFRKCYSLERAEILSKPSMLPYGMFRECTALKEIVIAEGTEKIGAQAFVMCESLETVTIPKGVKEIGDLSFNGRSLKNVEIQADLELMSDISFYSPVLEEIKITGSVKRLYLANCNPIIKSLTFPEGLETIDIPENAELELALESVTLPRSFKEVIKHKEDHMKHTLPTAMFYVPDSSFAEEFCKKRGYRYTVIK